MILNSEEIHVQNKEERSCLSGCAGSQVEPRQSMCEGLGLIPTARNKTETNMKAFGSRPF